MATAQITRQQAAIRNVLVATDFSRRSKITLDFGLDFAHHYGAKTYILHVLPVQEYAMAGPEAFVAAQDAARRDLLELKQQLKACSYNDGDDYHLVLGEGDIAESIMDCAGEKNVDLIVLGTHGRKGFSLALMGSVAEHVFRHSPVPVLTLGPALDHAPSVSPRRLLVPIDFTSASRASVQYVFSLACEHQAGITLLHVLPKLQSDAVADVELVEQGTREHLAELARDCAEQVDVQYRVETGKVAPTILQVACEIGADLLVLGVHRLPHLRDRIRWQVAYDVMREAPCPVLTVRKPA
jgi:nucleotide-binding universal stress UspA family protein